MKTRVDLTNERPKGTLGDIADIVMGQSPPGETVSVDKGLALLNGPTEFGNHHPIPVQFTTEARKVAKPGDILFCVRGSTTGRMNWADQEYAIGRGIAAIRHREEPGLQPLLRGIIEVELPDVLAEATGSTFPNLSSQQLANIPVPVLAKTEQRAIAHILGTLDDKIELNRQMNQTLEAMARSIFRDWFVDFGPVRAKMEGQDPYLPPELWDLFPDDMVDSELGEIPEGWEVKALDDIANYQNGLALQRFRPLENEERLPAVKIAQLRTGRADGGEWAKGTIRPECIIDNGDVIFSWSGSLMVKVWCGGRAALNQHLFKVTSDEYPKWFYLQRIESHLPEFQSIAADKTTTMGHIKREHLRGATCVAPSRVLVSAADDILMPLFSQQISGNLECNVLESQRDALLPKLISGEIKAG